jgi:CRISPR-associated endonuclease/helicase Cas3
VNKADFGAFFVDLNGREPFPWQARLAEDVCSTDTWPDQMNLPTGSGKTACIDVALFHWLVSAAAGRPQRAARRIAFVVDRRIIVDEASERASRIAAAIQKGTTPLLARTRALLEEQGNDGGLLRVVTLRGGVERERALVRDPRNVAVLLSTVDQIGSRLLFRGYGVSERMQSVDAGVFGVDTLLLLDEAHIAEPFQETLRAIVREQRRAPHGALGPKPLGWVQLSATLSQPKRGGGAFALDDTDRRHPELAKRLTARKPMRLLEIEKREALGKQMVELVVEELDKEPLSQDEAPRVAIVVNRIASARAIYEAIKGHKKLKGKIDPHLLIGRVRPLERDERMKALKPALASSTKPRPGDKPIVVIATQTIEVGADFDFHALFTEAASYPALKQRVGRLNRLGARGAARGAIVLVRAEAEGDRIYGDTIRTTWEHLRAHASDGEVDLGIAKAPPDAEGTAPKAKGCPILSRSVLELLTQTNPRPAIEPSVGELLHGFEDGVADVSVIWRDGIAVEDDSDALLAREILAAWPPLSLEAMSLPYSSFRAWIRDREGKNAAARAVDCGDLDGEPPEDEEERRSAGSKVLLVRGADVALIPFDRVPPGSTVVVPASFGGADEFGFAPGTAGGVRDLTLVARHPPLRAWEGTTDWRRGRRAVIVFTPALARSWIATEDGEERAAIGEAIAAIEREIDDDDVDIDDASASMEELFDTHGAGLRADVRETCHRAKSGAPEWLYDRGARRGLIVSERAPTRADVVEGGGGLVRTVDVTLEEHLRGVGEYAQRVARSVGLSEPLSLALHVAGETHDLGKADERFQARLGGSPEKLLAKGARVRRDTENRDKSARHEAYSVALLDRHPELIAGATEHAELVRYLVGTHHGRGRAMHPTAFEDRGTAIACVVGDRPLNFLGKPGLDALEAAWPELFSKLQDEYGPWGLAYLEAILRLADHRRSEDEVNAKEGA